MENKERKENKKEGNYKKNNYKKVNFIKKRKFNIEGKRNEEKGEERKNNFKINNRENFNKDRKNYRNSFNKDRKNYRNNSYDKSNENKNEENKDVEKDKKFINKGKPRFLRQNAKEYKRVGLKWRKPRGKHSGMRLNLKGYPATVSVGYKKDKEFRNKHPSKYNFKLIRTFEELEKINPVKEVVYFSSNLGKKKKIFFYEYCKYKKIKVLNYSEIKEEEKDKESI